MKIRLDDPERTKDERDYLCFVAGKVLYFGVGGGMADFLEAVGNAGDRLGTETWCG